MTACGTAFYACMVGKSWLEKRERLAVESEVASELRYREPPLPEGGVCIAVSQSGETVDTLAALRYAKTHKQTILSVVNVPESAIARESHVVLPTLAGPEIGVASTKAFTTQLTVLLPTAMGADRRHIRHDCLHRRTGESAGRQAGAAERRGRQCPPGQPRGGGDHATVGRPGGGADPLHRAGANARLLHGGRQGHRRGPATQPRQECDGRVAPVVAYRVRCGRPGGAAGAGCFGRCARPGCGRSISLRRSAASL